MPSPDIETELIAKIESAFASVILGDGDSIYDASTEWGPSAPNPKLANCEENDWRLLKDAELEVAQTTLSFVNIEGYRYYLPAYMKWTILRHEQSSNAISDFTIYSLEPKRYKFVDYFTTEQTDAVLAFLDYCSNRPDSLDSIHAANNASAIRSLLQNAG